MVIIKYNIINKYLKGVKNLIEELHINIQEIYIGLNNEVQSAIKKLNNKHYTTKHEENKLIKEIEYKEKAMKELEYIETEEDYYFYRKKYKDIIE